MPKSKKPRKGRAVRHGIQLTENHRFWLPINNALLAQCKSSAIAAVSTDFVSDRLHDAILDPLDLAIDRMGNGTAQFIDFWCVLQSCYLYAHCLSYVLQDEKWRFEHKFHDDYWRDKHRALLREAEDFYPDVIKAIGERQKRTGKYGLSGDDREALRAMRQHIAELLSWGSVRMVYHSALACVNNIERVESQLHKKWGQNEVSHAGL